jgi:hypothetical protein
MGRNGGSLESESNYIEEFKTLQQEKMFGG